MSFIAFRDQVVRNGGKRCPEASGASESRNRLVCRPGEEQGDERDRYFCSMRARDGGGRANTSMTLVGHPGLRNRNELVSRFIPICHFWDKMGVVTLREYFGQRCRCGF